MLPVIASRWPKIRRRRSTLRAAALIFLASWTVVRVGIFLGATLIPPGLGYPPAGEVADDLFRFDANYYLDIAEHGYVYDGDPTHAPNIVFAPLYPLAIRAAALGPFDKVRVGFALNKLFLFLAISVWLELLSPLGKPRARWTLFALTTAAGSYAFHAYYSEALMFFALGLILLGFKHARLGLTTVGAVIAGATRLTALPIIALISVALILRGWRRREPAAFLAAALSPAGALAYLGYLAWAYHAEPLSLIALCQKSSWAHFHPPFITWTRILNGYYLARDAQLALGRGWATLVDIRTINLAWMLLGLIGAAYALWRRLNLEALLFASYAAFIYASNAGSEYLISTHRFMLLMVPIFVMAGDLTEALARRSVFGARLLAGVLIAINLGYGLLHTAMFNQGAWHWF